MAKEHVVKNPYSGRSVGRVITHAPKQGLAMLTKAKKVFEILKKTSRYERARALMQISDALKQQKETFAKTLMQEAGKPITLARAEVDRAIFTFAYAAEEIKRFGQEALPMDLIPGAEGRRGLVERFPIGPILGITPFNFPLNLVAHKVAPALAVGNPIIIKPNILTPFMSLQLKNLVDRSSFPKDSMQVALLEGADAEAIVVHDDCAMVSFTGSAQIGWHVKQVAAKKKVALELGGNAIAVLSQDGAAGVFAEKVARAAFAYAGQSCISVQTALIHESHYESVKRKIVSHTKALKVGDPAKTATWCGPVINESAADRLESWIKEAADKGAKVLTGGKRQGLVITPCVLENVGESEKISCEEAFGPVVLLKPFKLDGEAIRFINRSKYGLQSGLFTNHYPRIQSYFESLEVGGLMVNEVPTYRIDHMPYGGVKDSGFGREGLKWTMEEMTEPKLLMVSL